METIWIIGAGHFGLRAVQKLSECQKKRHFVIADINPENLEKGKGENRLLVQTDGVDFLNKHLCLPSQSQFPQPDWIIPALPVHLAAEWSLRCFGSDRLCRIPLPAEIDRFLPNPIRGSSGDIYVSHATFICPEDCAEPRDICTVTQKPRKQNMFEILSFLSQCNFVSVNNMGFQSLVIRSHQLGTGVGGYRPEQLFNLLAQIEKADNNILISTACRCHGVVTGLKHQ